MGSSGYKVPPRQEALRRQQWLESRSTLTLSHVIEGMRTNGPQALRDAYDAGFWNIFSPYRDRSDEQRELAELERRRIEIATGEAITADEAEWLVAQIERDGELTFNERALLMHIAVACPSVDAALAPLIDRARAVE